MAKDVPWALAAAVTAMPKLFSKSILRLTPQLYFPCRNCGLWRRQHVGKERKCPFASGCFDPTKPSQMKSADRIRLNDRIEVLRRQIIQRPSDQLEWLDGKVDELLTLASSDCSHKYDDGTDATDRQPVTVELDNKIHVICELCKEDWYE